MPSAKSLKQIHAQWITPDKFKPYGQVISAVSDGKLYDATDAALVLIGIPRLYIMRLHDRGRRFAQMTRHLQCTQCLGSLAATWLIAVAPPSPTPHPLVSEITAFQIPGDCFIKLEQGTWHAGPYFDGEFVDFYNLELSDTNIGDRYTYNFKAEDNLEFEIVTYT